MLPGHSLVYLLAVATIIRWVSAGTRWKVLAWAGALFLVLNDPSGRSLWVCGIIVVCAWSGGILIERLLNQSDQDSSFQASLAYGLAVFAVLATWTAWRIRSQGLPPLGASFYSLVAIGYLSEVRWKKLPAELNFGKMVLLHAFFPALQAGPIERAPAMLNSIRALGRTSALGQREIIFPALALICAGCFKKLVLADGLAPFLEPLLARPEEAHSGLLVAAAVLAPYRLFCDFSGYTDLAMGAGLLLGFQLTPNFKRPLLAVTVSDFWRRWHISLINWLRDYVAQPLKAHVGLALSTAAALVGLGLWHGFQMRFLLFGLIQALAVTLEIIWGWGGDSKLKEQVIVKRVWTWAVLLPSFLLIACPDLPTVERFLQSLISNWSVSPGMDTVVFGRLPWVLLACGGLEVMSALHSKRPLLVRWKKLSSFNRWAVVAALAGIYFWLGNFSAPIEFAYRRF